MVKITSYLSPINLDANASVPPLQEAKLALLAAMDLQGNASSPHALGRRLRAQLDSAREYVASALGGRDKELFFCSGASEGNRWMVDAIVHSGELRRQPFRVLASPLEHPSLMKCLLAKAEAGKIDLELIPFKDGMLQLDSLSLQGAEVVFVTAAHNESGYVPDMGAIADALPHETILVSDATQAVGRMSALPLRVDAIVCSSHKMGGVVGAGAVLLRGQARKLSAPWIGGGQEAGLRPGSESVPLIASMGEAAQHIDETRRCNVELEALREEIEAELLQEWPFAFVVGKGSKRLPQTLAICLDNVDAEGLRIAVDQAGVCVGFGSACSALAPEPSPALLALGLTAKQARATIRISLAPMQDREHVWEGIARLKKAVASLLAI